MRKRELYSEDVIRLAEDVLTGVLKFVNETYYVDEVFSDEELDSWAIDNGYVKKESE